MLSKQAQQDLSDIADIIVKSAVLDIQVKTIGETTHLLEKFNESIKRNNKRAKDFQDALRNIEKEPINRIIEKPIHPENVSNDNDALRNAYILISQLKEQSSSMDDKLSSIEKKVEELEDKRRSISMAHSERISDLNYKLDWCIGIGVGIFIAIMVILKLTL